MLGDSLDMSKRPESIQMKQIAITLVLAAMSLIGMVGASQAAYYYHHHYYHHYHHYYQHDYYNHHHHYGY